MRSCFFIFRARAWSCCAVAVVSAPQPASSPGARNERVRDTVFAARGRKIDVACETAKRSAGKGPTYFVRTFHKLCRKLVAMSHRRQTRQPQRTYVAPPRLDSRRWRHLQRLVSFLLPGLVLSLKPFAVNRPWAKALLFANTSRHTRRSTNLAGTALNRSARLKESRRTRCVEGTVSKTKR